MAQQGQAVERKKFTLQEMEEFERICDKTRICTRYASEVGAEDLLCHKFFRDRMLCLMRHVCPGEMRLVVKECTSEGNDTPSCEQARNQLNTCSQHYKINEEPPYLMNQPLPSWVQQDPHSHSH